MKPVTKIEIPGAEKIYSGKVRDLFRVDDEHMLIASTDRISAFDWVFPNGIPGKGIILNQVSNMWFRNIKQVKNHIVEDKFSNFPKPFCDFPELLENRSIIVKKTERIDFECVARGYIIGGGWKEYQEKGSVCGIELPSGLQMAQKLENPIYTPATKAEEGHDENVAIDVVKDALGEELAEKLKELTISIYETGRDIMEKEGIILADTKFEFGMLNNELILIDEVLTPDSSRYWEKSLYKVGTSPVSFDKQFIRDYLETTDWDKNSPPPPLPDEIIEKTLMKYQEIHDRVKKVLGE